MHKSFYDQIDLYALVHGENSCIQLSHCSLIAVQWYQENYLYALPQAVGSIIRIAITLNIYIYIYI